jgi:hypothetical protein
MHAPTSSTAESNAGLIADPGPCSYPYGLDAPATLSADDDDALKRKAEPYRTSERWLLSVCDETLHAMRSSQSQRTLRFRHVRVLPTEGNWELRGLRTNAFEGIGWEVVAAARPARCSFVVRKYLGVVEHADMDAICCHGIRAELGARRVLAGPPDPLKRHKAT